MHKHRRHSTKQFLCITIKIGTATHMAVYYVYEKLGPAAEMPNAVWRTNSSTAVTAEVRKNSRHL
jgi:hypothetical protein